MKINPTAENREQGTRVKLLRKSLGMTQDRFAAAVGMSVAHLSRIENGLVAMGDAVRMRISQMTTPGVSIICPHCGHGIRLAIDSAACRTYHRHEQRDHGGVR